MQSIKQFFLFLFIFLQLQATNNQEFGYIHDKKNNRWSIIIDSNNTMFAQKDKKKVKIIRYIPFAIHTNNKPLFSENQYVIYVTLKPIINVLGTEHLLATLEHSLENKTL